MSVEMSDAPAPSLSLDSNGEDWRRFYFFRNALKTLYEIKNAISSLHEDSDFRKLLESDGSDFYSDFLKYLKTLDTNLGDLKRLHHALGGHVSKEAIKSALDNMDFDTIGSFEIGKTEKDTHYGFANPICIRMFFDGIDLPQAKEFMTRIVHLLDHTTTIIGNLLRIYLSDRKLV
jgi:hypothetical protein